MSGPFVTVEVAGAVALLLTSLGAWAVSPRSAVAREWAALALAGANLALGIAAALYGVWPLALACALLAAVKLDQWWKRRRRGRAAKLVALVRDLGHRLTTVQVPA